MLFGSADLSVIGFGDERIDRTTKTLSNIVKSIDTRKNCSVFNIAYRTYRSFNFFRKSFLRYFCIFTDFSDIVTDFKNYLINYMYYSICFIESPEIYLGLVMNGDVKNSGTQKKKGAAK